METKVLLISERFSAGDAITGLNLFSKWNKSQLYIASLNTSFFYGNFNSGYRIGSAEIKFRFPFNYLNKVPSSKVIDCQKDNPIPKKQAGKLISKFYLKYTVPVLKWLGLFSYRVSYNVSEQFLRWVDEVSPDCVYSSIGSLNTAEFIDALMKARPQLRFIIHGYDDWVEPNYFTISKSYSRRSKSYLKNIISRACLTFSTSEKMSKDYRERYGREFPVFPNPTQQIPDSVIIDSSSTNVTFIGKILNHNIKSIELLASSLNALNDNLTLHIYSNVADEIKEKIARKYRKTVFHDWVSHDEIPWILRNSRILYLPISIDKQTVKFTKYSMSTKMSEYLASGVPMLYHGPDGIAMTELLEKHQCAFVVKSNDERILSVTIKQILEDENATQKVLENAFKLFSVQFEKERITETFKQIITEACI